MLNRVSRHFRVKKAGRDCVDIDMSGSQINREMPGQVDQASLAGGVRIVIDAGIYQAVDRGNIDHP
ncbi:hypothetical protein D3C80_2102500 [compost metagenome]